MKTMTSISDTALSDKHVRCGRDSGPSGGCVVRRQVISRYSMTQSSVFACLGHEFAVPEGPFEGKNMTQGGVFACLGHELAASEGLYKRKSMT